MESIAAPDPYLHGLLLSLVIVPIVYSMVTHVLRKFKGLDVKGQFSYAARRLSLWEDTAGRGEYSTSSAYGVVDGYKVVAVQRPGRTVRIIIDSSDLQGRTSSQMIHQYLEGVEMLPLRQKVMTGDDGFDRTVFLTGAYEAAHALMDATRRSLLAEKWPGRTVYVDKRRIIIETGIVVGRKERSTRIMRAVDTASLLEIPVKDIPARLAHNAGHDPVAAVRGRSLEVLARRLPAPAFWRLC